MKKLFFLFFSLQSLLAAAQNVQISDDIYIGGSTGYGVVGKFNDRILFYYLDNDEVKLRAFDAKMHKIWDREIEPDYKKSSKVLDIIGNRTDFTVLYQYRKKNHTYLKAHKYDGQVKLLDSATVFDWGKDFLTPTLTVRFSEDRRSALVYEFVDNKKLRAVAFNLDSLRPIWEQTIDAEDWKLEENYQQLVFSNRAEAFFIQEESNRIGNEKHRFKVQKADSLGKTSFSLPIKDFAIVDIKFSFDNVNRKLVGAGVLAVKNLNKSQGYFHFSIPPQYQDAADLKIYKEGFDDEFVSTLLGKKVTENKGLMDIKFQEIIHRRDGGILAIFEQVRLVERRINTNAVTGRFGDGLRASTDYYHDNFFAVSIANDGTTTWKSVFYKKQMSQDDEGKYSSYCLVKTPSTLRFLFNDEIERATTVSEYTLNSAGTNERHSVMNTAGQDLYLRFHDGVQTGANEVIIPSEDRRRIKLVKIQFILRGID